MSESGESHSMANTCIALNIFKRLAGSYKGEIRLKNCSVTQVMGYHSELERRGETVPNYLMKQDVVFYIQVILLMLK